MKNLKVKVAKVPVSDLMRLEALMPTREFKVWDLSENRYMVLVEKMVVAIVNVVDGEFAFDFAEKDYSGFLADRLREGMLLLNPELDPDRVLWVVVFPWYDAWSYCGSPKATREAALQNLVRATFSKPGAMLVEFKASEWPCQALKVDKCYEITGTLKWAEVGSEDLGEKIFLFTTLENFVKNEE